MLGVTCTQHNGNFYNQYYKENFLIDRFLPSYFFSNFISQAKSN